MDSEFGEDEEEPKSPSKKSAWAFRLGIYLAALLVVALGWVAWNLTLPRFGAPRLNFLEFGALTFLVFYFRRVTKS